MRFVVSVVFTPTRGVIHPSFPLRGRWERIAKSGEQAPSPSLASLLNSSCETHSCTSLMHGLRQCRAYAQSAPSHLLTNTWLRGEVSLQAQICPPISFWNHPNLNWERETAGVICLASFTQFQDPSNKIFGLTALSVFLRVARRIKACAGSSLTTSGYNGFLGSEPRP